jgi:hypothetical protein
VAVILAYLEAVQKKERILTTTSDDERLRKLSEERFSNSSDDWEDVEDDLGKDDFQAGSMRIGSQNRRGANDRSQNLKEYLSGMTNDSLVDFMLELAQRHPEVREAAVP